MPFTAQIDKEVQKVINFIGVNVFPVCMALSLPIFLHHLVMEKQLRLVEIMKINGLKMRNYWIVNSVVCFCFFTATATFTFVFGKYVFAFDFYKDTHVMFFVELFACWGISNIALSVFFSSFMNCSSTASMMGYTLSIWTCTLCSNITQAIYTLPRRLPQFLMYYPSFPFVRAIYLLADPCTWDRCYGEYHRMPAEFREMQFYLLFDSFCYTIAGLYLHQVVPQTYGVPKHPLFFIQPFIRRNFPDLYLKIYGDETNLKAYMDEEELAEEDQDTKGERRAVYELKKENFWKYPLISKDIRKVYPGTAGRPPMVANKNISFKIEQGELFGLLGPNGAGKTTLITQLTGLYPPTLGNAWIGGYDIRNQLEKVQLQIGVCPQFDVLWEKLTVEEHLLFYARIKGIPPEQEDLAVTKALKEVHLSEQRDVTTAELPLGMKRRLSIAISLVSSPKVVFLDEPTTGLGPDTRR